jgi:uncharacterized protein Usg
MTVWGLDTPQQLERFYARKLNGLMTLFWQHYRAADNDEQKRTVLEYDWGSHIDGESLRYAHNRSLSRIRRIQLKAILKKNKRRLDWIERLGAIKMRASHGE